MGLNYRLRAVDSWFLTLPRFPDHVIDRHPETPWPTATVVATLNTFDGRDDIILDFSFTFFSERNDQVKAIDV